MKEGIRKENGHTYNKVRYRIKKKARREGVMQKKII